MDRTCDRCSNPAVVHETLVHNGVKSELHLCAEHAVELGYLLPGEGGAALVVGSILEGQSAPVPRRVKQCGSCGMTMQSLRDSHLVGCPQCYSNFEEELAGLVERSQEGASTHVGRHPANAAGLIDRAAVRNRLARELREAIGREEYERAARIRDEMAGLGEETGSSTHAGGEA
jgi:protein arginine kinase activator